ncbi:MAG: TlpA family protein disulfide reductase, partial [Gaiellaceae bacterium]
GARPALHCHPPRDMSEHLRRSRVICALLLALAVLLPAAGCGGDSDGAADGGASDLPGQLPEGVAFRAPPADAPPAPEISAELVDGTPVTASDLWDDRPVVLVFTASWCDRCADVHRRAAEVVDEHEGVALLGVVPADDAEGAREYAEELELGYPIAVGDEHIWLNYAVREPPAVVLVSSQGRVLRGWPGGVERTVLARRLDELFQER